MQNSKVIKSINLFLFIFTLIFTTAIAANAQVDVARQTTAITYPLDEVVQTQFRGTTRFPRMKGEAKIKRTSRNGTEIELTVSKMPRPFELGAGYATYVLWAVSPDGQIDNLGEIKRRGFFEFDSRISVTTPLQTFALIVTAEPHFLVRQPSQAIMLENLTPYSQSGRTIATTRAVQYFGNSSDFFRDARTPEIAEIDYSKTPSTILQAKQAVALAQFAGAGRDAVDEYTQATTLLNSAETAWKAGRPEEQIDITARQAISAAVKAEMTAAVRKEAREKRNERTRQDAEVRLAEEKFLDAQSQIDDLKSELARETRNRELAERDALNYSNQVRELREELGKLREELGKTKVEVDSYKNRVNQIESERQAAEQAQTQAQAQQDRIAQLQANEPFLMQTLKRFGTVARNERGIILTLPENLWSGIRLSSLAPASDLKLSGLGEVLSSNTDYKIIVEAHTDNRGTPDVLQTLTQERAQAIVDKMASLGIAQDRFEAKGFGASLPVASNTTNANRAKNRRLQLILVPNYN
ncbi:MAG: outer membrane protein-like peptidoglycan-associated protein [Acidobacteria bacterium]|jgi:outer membrane protein OmpA-like peptidoglycan-associated protein|nr:outer membrane protein-like peptidoglycan-associated protein [Acidobacteriota bacterium]